MKIAITGLINSGKTTIFNALTGLNQETTVYSSKAVSPNIGTVKVPDERIDKLSSIFKPKKTTFATIEYIDFLGLTIGDSAHNTKVVEFIKDSDAVVKVLRFFDNDSVSHPMDMIDPLRDLESIDMELIISDLALVEKRLEKIDENLKKGRKVDIAEKDMMVKLRDNLESETPIREVELNEEERKSVRHLQFVTDKPEILLLNIAENDIDSEKADDIVNRIATGKGPTRRSLTALCGSVEMDIAQLPPSEAVEFLDDLGIEKPALTRLIDICYKQLGLISFLTVGEDEVRAWTIKENTTALKAAGKIHSDIEKGFIRAEVVSYNDFINAGNMTEARKRGQIHLEKKTYEVKDGDIINFKFNV